MGCCITKEAIATLPVIQDASNLDSATSPADEAPGQALKAKVNKNVVALRHKNDLLTNSGGSSTQPIGKTIAPSAPSGAIPINKGEAPPPGWGGNPEIEEIEIELDGRQTGPRAIKNVLGGNGYISGTRKDQEISDGVMDRIRGLEDAGLQTKKKMGLKMLTPRIITDVKETWDEDGNITRYMTHYIEEPDGRKHTNKETVYIAAGDPDPFAPELAAEAE